MPPCCYCTHSLSGGNHQHKIQYSSFHCMLDSGTCSSTVRVLKYSIKGRTVHIILEWMIYFSCRICFSRLLDLDDLSQNNSINSSIPVEYFLGTDTRFCLWAYKVEWEPSSFKKIIFKNLKRNSLGIWHFK